VRFIGSAEEEEPPPMPILPIGAAIMDTERMIPSQMNGGSPGKTLHSISVNSRLTRDQCYDFLNIFAEKFSKEIGVFYSQQS
jgi:hypothetical protein